MAVTKVKLNQLIQDGATDGQVLTWDNSLTIWKPTTISSGGSSSGIAGAVQISNGSGGFSSDATNFFFNDTTNQLQLKGGTGYGLLIAGNTTGAIDASAASSVTGAFNALRSNTNATGSVGITLNNTNNSSGTAHSKVTLSTLTGGGDPYFGLATSEVGYVIGIDNTSDKLLIGVGIDPSTMTTTNITLTGESMGVMQTSPTAKLHLGAGTTAANTAPLKLTSGTAMTTPEDGAIEYHASHLYFTIGSTRYQLDQQSPSSVPFNALADATGNDTLNNAAFTQSWAWNSITTANALTMSSSSITAGSILTINGSNNSLNSTGGLLYVVNSGTSTSGTVAKFEANNNVGGAGMIVRASGNIGIGTFTPTSVLHIGGTPNIANQGVGGMLLRIDGSAGVTDTTGSGSAAHVSTATINGATYYANSIVTYTDCSTLYIGDAPSGGTNVTITNPWAIYVNNGKNYFNATVSATNTVTDRFVIDVNSSGTAASGFGGALLFKAETSTTNSTDQTRISSIWSSATHGTRTSALVFSTVLSGGAVTEAMRIDGKQMIMSGQYVSTRFGLTDGATIALDWNNSNVQSVTLAGNRTFTFANPKDGGRYLIALKQDATGSRTVTWPTIVWAGGTAPTLTTTANKTDLVTLVYLNGSYYGNIDKNY